MAMASNIGGILKGLKTQAKQEINKLTAPRQSRPASTYGQQAPQQNQSVQQQASVYGGTQNQQNPQLQYQQLPAPQQGLPQHQAQQQYATHQGQSQFIPGQQYAAVTQHPQQQYQTPQSPQPQVQYQQYQPQPLSQVPATSPQPQAQAQHQYQNQTMQYVSSTPVPTPMSYQTPNPQVQNHRFSVTPTPAPTTSPYSQPYTPAPVAQYSPVNSILQVQSGPQAQVQSPQLQGQYHNSLPSTPGQVTSPYNQAYAPVTVAQYSPVSSTPQAQHRRQSQIMVQSQQQVQSPVHPGQAYQNATPPPMVSAQYQQQSQQSPVGSLARMSLQSPSPVQVQQHSTPPQNYQPLPPSGPPPAHLVQDPPPPSHHIYQAQVAQSQRPPSMIQGSPNPTPQGMYAPQATAQPQGHAQYVTASPQTLYQVQSHPQPPQSPAPQPQAHQTSVQNNQPLLNQASQPQYGAQGYTYAGSPAQTPAPGQLPQQYVQQTGSMSPTASLHRNSIPAPSQTPPSAPAVQTQQYSSQATARYSPQASSSSQSQFQSQMRNSIRRKPHPATQPNISPQSQKSAHISPQIQTIPESTSHVPPEAHLTGPLSDPSPYAFSSEFDPVELEDRSQTWKPNVVVAKESDTPTMQKEPPPIEAPLIESNVKSIETVSPKPIHPPPQYEPSPAPQQSQTSNEVPTTEILVAAITQSNMASAEQPKTHATPVLNTETTDSNTIALTPFPATEASTNIQTAPQVHEAIRFIPHDQLSDEKLPVEVEDYGKPKPLYQPYTPVMETAPKAEDVAKTTRSNTVTSEGKLQYQPYSPQPEPELQTQAPESYFPPTNEVRTPANSSSPQFQDQSGAVISVNQPTPAQAIPQSALPNSVPTHLSPSQLQRNLYTSSEVSRQPVPPPAPCPEHLRNQPPPPDSYFHALEASMYSTPMEQPQASQPIIHQGMKWACPLGAKKSVLTKYNKFYVPKHTLVPRSDPQIQELEASICESCFMLHISQNPSLSLSFEPFISPDATPEGSLTATIPTSRATCQFGVFPALKNTFYGACLPQASLQPLMDAIKQLGSLPLCPGNEVVEGGEFYTSIAIPHSSFCTQCFEANIKPSPFAPHFTMKLNGPDQPWRCDNGQDPGFTNRLLTAHLISPSSDFQTFSHELKKALAVSPCQGGDKPMTVGADNKIHAFGIQELDGLVCPSCFYDRVKLTPLENAFIPKTFDAGTPNITCDLASGISRFLFMIALEAKDMKLWHTGLLTFNRIPRCEGIKGVEEEIIQTQAATSEADATWYSITDYPNIEACPCCYHSVIKPLGGSHLFTPITRPFRIGVVRTCNFSVGAGGITSSNPADFPYTLYFRGFILRHLLEIGWESKKGDYAPFLSLAKEISSCAPPCGSNVRGFKRPNGRRWYGHVATDAANENECTIVMCQECYESHVRDTNLAAALGRDLTEEVYAGDPMNQKEAFCGPFSKKSKQVLEEAREKNDWTIFARHWNLRQKVRDSTLPLIKALQAEFAMGNMMKMSAMQSAMMIQGGASISEAAGTDGLDHGNSAVGYGFESSAGVDAAMARRNADNMKWGDASHVMKIAMLEAQWKEVE
ncbi:hypothetical protein GLAREA_08757 [Glarea lozoyensis ATCC 20868]|uniref:Integral membrane protein n=1 Tax=Glarea lozoyensis (strain ATCC 20868 / MF5171) TaxID=1116229 RepID=S3DHG5_GLAL2|nr:uncharacterized protein GLAREA_08757 [Glarea lozoyensis ATCC 20868]EPE36594.1 hypothetical protein GLAREA_08757 [Glarea lozoyensis ATCC 20868]